MESKQTSFYIKVLVAALLTLLPAINLSAQGSLLNKKITVSIVNKRFDAAIKIIQKETNINLCYNSEIIPKNKIVSVTANNNRLDKVLVPLLASVDLQMKEVNNQIVITKAENKAPRTSANREVLIASKEAPLKTEVIGKVVTVIDTVFHTVQDTVVKTVYDTVRVVVYDTKVIRQLTNINFISWFPKYSVSFSGSLLFPFHNTTSFTTNPDFYRIYSGYANLEKNKRGFSLDLSTAVKLNHTEISLGFEYMKLSNNASTSDFPGVISQKDSSIIGVSISANGISYKYKVDTVQRAVFYSTTSPSITYSYWGIPLILTYHIWETRRLNMGLSLGLTYSHLLKAKGFSAWLDNNKPVLNNNKGEVLAEDYLSVMAGLQLEYPISKRITLISSFRIRKTFGSVFTSNSSLVEKPCVIYPSISLKYNL
jgi:hypothetical protein